MELKELTEKFRKIIKNTDMISGINDILFSENKNKILLKYKEEIGGNLKTDELQKIFQYYYSDRKEKCQDFTPKSIAQLLAALTEINGKVVYDLCAGSGALTIQKWVKNPNKIFICEELDERVIPILLFNMAVRNMNGYIINRNALTLELKKCYKLTATDQFSNIEEIPEPPEILCDEIISNPPYNIKWEAPTPILADIRFQGKVIPPAGNANYAFVLTALNRLKQNGKCAFILPTGVLSGEPEKKIRKYLISNGLIERIITLPGGMFESTQIGTCIINFSFGNKSVKMFDCKQKTKQEYRYQNGQFGGASHENRTYHKIINVLPESLIDKLCGVCDNISEFSKEIGNDEIAKNDYILTCSRYIEFNKRKEIHRPYADIMADINRVSRERSIIKITCNETFAKEMGLYEVAKVDENKSNEELNKTFEMLGSHYESKRYITLTKSREFKIENQDKELWSSLIKFFLPMWKQHIYYLNQEENRLLAELRDALLPDLMSGRLNIDEETCGGED